MRFGRYLKEISDRQRTRLWAKLRGFDLPTEVICGYLTPREVFFLYSLGCEFKGGKVIKDSLEDLRSGMSNPEWVYFSPTVGVQLKLHSMKD